MFHPHPGNPELSWNINYFYNLVFYIIYVGNIKYSLR